MGEFDDLVPVKESADDPFGDLVPKQSQILEGPTRFPRDTSQLMMGPSGELELLNPPAPIKKESYFTVPPSTGFLTDPVTGQPTLVRHPQIAAEGLYNTAAKNLGALLSPVGVALGPAMEAAGPLAPALTGALALQGIQGIAEGGPAQPARPLTTGEQVERGGDVAAQALMAIAPAIHAGAPLLPRSLDTAKSLLERSRNAIEKRKIQESVQPERAGTEAQRLPTETSPGDSLQPEAQVQAKEDVVSAASYTNPETGVTTTAPNHPEAQIEQGVEPTQPRSARETPEFGFEVTKPTGEKVIVPRGTAEEVARESGQLIKEPKSDKVHSDEIASPVDPSKPLSEVPKTPQDLPEATTVPKVEEQTPVGVPPVLESGASIAQKEEAYGGLVRDKILNAPSFPKLLAAAKSFQKSLGKNLREDWEDYAKQSPWDLLSEHAGVMNAKSARAKTLKSLADAVIKETGLPVQKPGTYRGMEYRIDWDRVASTQQPPVSGAVRGKATTKDIIGMGGAVPSEFEVSPKTPTGIRNAQVDVERAQRGLPPAIEPARRSFGTVWDEAMARIDRDPASQDQLIEGLERKPRALTDHEDAMLLHRQIGLQNEYGKATRDLAQAYEDGRVEATEAERIRVAGLSDQLLRLYNLGKKVGTETGRGLAARKMMAYEDYSLASMDLGLRAAKGGKPLTPQETAEITRLNQKIQETQKAYDDYRAATETRIAQAETARVLAEMKASTAPAFDKRILSAAESIVTRMEQAAKPAADRLRDRLSRMSAGVDPTIVADAAIVGSAKIARAGLDLAKFTDEMVREFGEKLRPMINDIWTEANKLIDTATAKAPETRRVIRNATLQEVKDSVVDQVKKKVAAGKNDEITWFVQKLARELVKSGITEREPLIDAVHDVLKGAVPGITRRQTMDAISGYGDFKQLRKDYISVQLRGMKGEMQQLAKLEDMAKGEPPLKSGVERRTPTEAERKLIKEVNDAKNKFQVPVSDPSTQLKSALDTLKTTLRNRIADYQDRMARGDYSPRPRREVVLDPEASRLKAENERVKKQFQRQVAIERLKNAGAVERGANWITKWRRGFILSGVHTLGKLTAAAMQRMAFTPAEEAVGGIIGKAIPSVSEKAAREGGFSAKAEAKAIVDGIVKGMKDSWQTLRTGQSDLDVLYGKEALLPPSAIDFFGHVHGALKAPTKRAEFTRSLTKRTEHAIRNGVDVTDPMVQSKLVIDSYKDANRSIFLQDNRVVDFYKRGLAALERKDKITGQTPLGAKAAATTARVLLPIVKVPTNIVAETMQYAVGSVTGSARLARAFARGIDNLHPEEADLIMRHLKKGSVGAAVMLLGFLNPEFVGGYYQPGEKRKKGDVKVGSIKIGDISIPSFLLHNPLLETAQIGATVRRVADSKLNRRDLEKQGISNGVIAAGLGLAEQVPFVREMTDVTKAFNPRERGAFLGELGKSLLIPRFMQEAAEMQDKDAQGNVIPRKPRTVFEHIKTGLPVLREDVPKKKTP